MQATLPSRLLGISLNVLLAGSLAAGAVTDTRNAGVGSAGNNRANAPAAITYESGDLPIILSAPHGGRNAIPGVPERAGKGARRFSRTSDLNTGVLTGKLADALERKTGKRPYVVIARFHRKYIDANRRSKDAYESPGAKAAYDAYHAAIESARRDVASRWGRGVLLDIHGQAFLPGAVLRGTQNGRTASQLVKRFGDEALIGESSLFGQLAKQGFTVVPPIGSSDLESPNYNGGFTVVTHGSRSGGAVDAIQLELGRALRVSTALDATADKLSNAIAAFAKQYLPVEEQPLRQKIQVGVYRDEGAGRSVNDLLRALSKFDEVSVTTLTAEQIRSGDLSELDILIQPGGSGGGQGRHLGENGREEIRKFVRNGGGFIGICAGAYLASAHYSWSLNLLDAKVLDTKHWNRGKGTVDITLTDAGREVLSATRQRLPIHYAQGPLLAPAHRPEIEDYEEMASFQTEVAKNGAPKGVMIGTTAIARGRFGKGRVICFSPHPELTKGLEAFVQDAIDHVNRNRR